MKVVQVVASIGNSDNKLSQAEWSKYCQSVGTIIEVVAKNRYFSGFSPCDAPWQNAAWWFSVREDNVLFLRQRLREARCLFNQDSIAMIIAAETEMV